MNILEFSRTITDDLQNYDLNGACGYFKGCSNKNVHVLWFFIHILGPVLMDEYVEWRKARLSANTDTL